MALIVPSLVVHSLSAVQVWHSSTLPFAVDVHVLVPGLQLFVPQGVSLATVHCTQLPASQIPFPVICEQSESAEQGAQACVVASHREALDNGQEELLRQATQVLVASIQNGVAPAQAPLQGAEDALLVPPIG